MFKGARSGRVLPRCRPRGSPPNNSALGLNVCWRRTQHSPAGSQTLEFNDRSPSRHEAGDRTIPRRRPPQEPLYENYEALSLHAPGLRVAQAHYERVGRVYGVIGSGVGRIERHLSSSCGSINHWHAGAEWSEEVVRSGRRMQWYVMQRWAPRECCRVPGAPAHRRPMPPPRPDDEPRPSCSFHNLPESYETERARSVPKCAMMKKVSPRVESSEAEERPEPSTSEAAGEEEAEERVPWSLLIPEEEGSYFDDDDYDSDSSNSRSRATPDKNATSAEPSAS